MKWKDYKYRILVVIIVYLLVCICGVGSFLTALKAAKEMEATSVLDKTTELWGSYALRPVTVITEMFSEEAYKTIFIYSSIAILAIFVYMSIKYFNKTRQKYEYQGTENGSSDWSKHGEEFKKLKDGSEILNKHDGFILSRDHYLGLDTKKVKINKNILVFGGSGTGKTTCYVIPNILQKLGSYVITDPKGELYRDTSGYLKNAGYDVKIFNLVNMENSNRYNPLAHIRDYTDVDIIAHTIVFGGSDAEGGGKSSDPFWDNTAAMLLKACIYYVISVLPEEERNLSSCLNIVRAGGSDESIFDDLFIGELKPEHPGRKEYEGIRVGADKTKQSIAISLVSKLSHFDSPSMMKLTTSNDIDFEAIGEKKTAVYVMSPDSHSTYNYILTIFYAQLLQRLYSEADKNGGALKQPTYLLLDEFANIGKIPDFNQKLSTSRSRGISMSIIIQSLDQLVDLYKDLYENIISNCDTQLFLGSQSIKTCEYFSKSLGQKTLSFQNKSKNMDKKDTETQGYSYTDQRQGRELMTVDELKRLGMDEEIILVRGLKPIKAKKAWYFKYHPEKDTCYKYKIHDLSGMPKIPDVGVHTMDVVGHIAERKNRAKEALRQNREEKIDIDIDENKTETIKNTHNTSNISNNFNDAMRNTEENLDLQQELERKFDEIFGSNSNEVEE